MSQDTPGSRLCLLIFNHFFKNFKVIATSCTYKVIRGGWEDGWMGGWVGERRGRVVGYNIPNRRSGKGMR